MSTENKANDQRRISRRGPDQRFVWGIIAVVILCGILYADYTKISSLKNKLDNSVSKEKYNKLEKQLQNEKASKADLEKQVAELQKEKVNAQSDIESLKNENIELDNKLKKRESYPGARLVIPVNYDKDDPKKTVMFVFRWCPAGTFTMGSPSTEEGRADNETRHKVTLTKGFWILETEVTQKQWKAVMGNNPSLFKGDDLPVEWVSWNDCQEFCKKCSELGLPVQLPTEAQWEYACRAGTTGAYAGDLNEMTWYSDNSDEKTHTVGTKKPNAWGLYDMHGNVWEWCLDWYTEDYPSDSVTDPPGPLNGSGRVNRCGGWYGHAKDCRSARRIGNDQGLKNGGVGFRVILVENE